jgi:adenylate cyclase
MAQMIRVYRLQIGDSLSPVQLPSLNKPTILVLPFINQSGDAEQAYFADGITEDIILELGKFHELAVIARTSSFAYNGKHKKAQEIGAELGTRYVVEGSISKIGDAVRIAVQLWETATGAQLWAERYERNLHEIFAVQDDLTQKVVSTVMGRVVQAAYKQGLTGRQFMSRHCPPQSVIHKNCQLAYVAMCSIIIRAIRAGRFRSKLP